MMSKLTPLCLSLAQDLHLLRIAVVVDEHR
jgi:hypothetical protein